MALNETVVNWANRQEGVSSIMITKMMVSVRFDKSGQAEDSYIELEKTDTLLTERGQTILFFL